jgi:hypothetical protein
MVREYILGRYDLGPESTGFISLVDKAVDGPDGRTWDGVAIALFIDKEALRFEEPEAGTRKASGTGPQAPVLSQAPGKPKP